MAQQEETEYEGYDGISMFMRKWIPEGDPKAAVLAIHGLGAHSGTISTVCEYLANNGFVVYTPDLRGFGHYSGEKGHIESFDEYNEDLHKLAAYIRSQHITKSHFVYGHSLGGLIALHYAAEYPESFDGLVLPCPAISERLEVSKVLRILAGLLSKLNVKKKFENGLNHDLISSNPEVVKRNKEDPLRYDMVTSRYAASGLKAREEGALLGPRITTPIFLSHTSGDQILIPEKTREFFETVAAEDKLFKMYDDFYHEPFEEPGAEQILQDIISWLNERITS
ncbi:MAG: alpha/beta hydrolase [Candidatus Thorarchaeota archaeon]